MIKQAVILAAGEGKRMKRSATEETIINTPKPLIEINGLPIIEYTIRRLNYMGLDIAVVINKKDEDIFRRKLNAYNIHYYYQEKPLGTANALYSAKDFIKDDYFLVIMGDDLSNFNVEEIINIENPAVFGYEVEDLTNFGAIIMDANGLACEILEKKKKGRGLANTGVYIMPKTFFDMYSNIKMDQKEKEFYLTDFVKIMYNRGNGFQVKLLNFWRPINDFEELRKAKEDLSKFDYLSMKIRKATIKDVPELLKILYQLSPLENIENCKKNDENIVFNKIAENEDYYLMIAEIDGQIIATATLLIQQNLSHHARPYGHIENVVTDINYRGKNIGNLLMHYLIGLARIKNCYKLILNCSKEQVEFYRKSGFEIYNEVEMRFDI